MKCLNPSCDWTGNEDFCAKCRTPTRSDPQVVQCTGIQEGGNMCQAQLHASQRFCSDCGTKVDQSLFTRHPTTLHQYGLSTTVKNLSEDKDTGIDENQSSGNLESTSDVDKKNVKASNEVKSKEFSDSKYYTVLTPPTPTQIEETLRDAGKFSGDMVGKEKLQEIKKNSGSFSDIRYATAAVSSTDNSEIHNNDVLSKEPKAEEDTFLNKSFESQSDRENGENTCNIFVENEIQKDKKRRKKNKKQRKRERESREKLLTSFPGGNQDQDVEKNTPESTNFLRSAKERKEKNGTIKADSDLTPGGKLFVKKNNTGKKPNKNNTSETQLSDKPCTVERTNNDKNQEHEIEKNTPEFTKIFGAAKEWRENNSMSNADSDLSYGNTLFNTKGNTDEHSNKNYTNDTHSADKPCAFVETIFDKNKDQEIEKKSQESTKAEKEKTENNSTTKRDSDLPPGGESCYKKGNTDKNYTSDPQPSEKSYTRLETNLDTMKTTIVYNRKEYNSTEDRHASNMNEGNENRLAARNSESERMITVIFHAIISKDFSFNTDKDKLFIQTDLPDDNWKSNNKICAKKGIDSDMPEMVFKMDVPASRITDSSKVHYRYCIQKHGEKKPIHESYISPQITGKGSNRTLQIIKQWKDTDMWHQYDGVIEKEDLLKDYTPNIFNWKKKNIQKKAVEAFERFFEDIVRRTEMLLKDQLDYTEVLLHCFKKIYHHDGGIWNSVPECEKEFGNRIVKTLLDVLSKCKSGFMESKETIEKRIGTSLQILLFKSKTNADTLKNDHITLICKALLIRPDPDKKECAEIEFVLSHFLDRKSLTKLLLRFVKEIATTSKNPVWLYLMPWIHFLDTESLPYQEPQFGQQHDADIPHWWGIPYMKQEIESFKQKHDVWSIPETDVLNTLCPLFEMDFLLERTVLAAVTLNNLKTIIRSKMVSIEVLLANLIFHLRNTGPGTNEYQHSVISYNEREAIECVELVLEQLQETFEWKGTCIERLKKAIQFSFEMVKEAGRSHRHRKLYSCVNIHIHCMALYDQCIRKEGKNPKETEYSHLIEELAKFIKDWTDKHCSNMRRYMKENLNLWRQVFAPVHIQSEIVKDAWNEILTIYFDDYLADKVITGDKSIMARFIYIYCEVADTFGPCMQKCLKKAAFLVIERGEFNTIIKETLKSFQNQQLRNLLSELFLHEWQKNNIEEHEIETILVHALTWTPMSEFLNICQTKPDFLTKRCEALVMKTINVINDTLENLVTGGVSVLMMNHLKLNESKLQTLALQINESRWKKVNIRVVIEIRDKEVTTFKENSKYIASLLQLCQQLEIEDATVLTEVLHKQSRLEDCTILDLCCPSDITNVNTVTNFEPCIALFDDIPSDLLSELAHVHACQKSVIFQTMWQEECFKKKNECKTLSEVYETVWKPAKERFHTLKNKIMRGNIKFSEFECYFGKGKHEIDMRSELEKVQINKSIITKRLDQITRFRQLGMCVRGAKIILEFKECYALSGNFDQVRKIAEKENMDMEITAFDEELMDTFQMLMGLTDKQAECIAVFNRSKPLVTWLKQTIKSGLKEFSVFLDLAFMWAGDDPMNISKVRCFHSAVIGYAPLIFDLKQDIDCNQLLKACHLVWKGLEKDEMLPEKMMDTELHLEWFKNVQAAHGSVEVTSLKQAHDINSTGIYVVGNEAKKSNQSSTVLALDCIFSLTAVIGSQKERRDYSIKEVQDLQSRLMLVAGKLELESNSVERFTEVFDSVLRLSNAYMKLLEVGCVLFMGWTAKFLCDEKLKVCAILEFETDKDIQPLKYRRGKEADLHDIIKNLASFMESCYEDWLHHIVVKRQIYKELNYFTNDQLVILQKELVKFGKQTGPSQLVYPLLSAMRRKCTEYHLNEAINEAKSLIQDFVLKEEKKNQNITSDDNNAQRAEAENDIEQNFIQEILKMGYDEKLALKALKYVSPEQIDEGVCWCIEHADDASDEDNDDCNEAVQRDTRSSFTKWSESDITIQQMIAGSISSLRGNKKEKGYEPMLRDLEEVWGNFIGSLSSSICDYLSLDHLGVILQCLHKDEQAIPRSLPNGLYANEPNLIVCPPGDVLANALYIYMFSRDQALPQADEVLLCSPKTTFDEIDIFWRRAIFDSNGKIHCLVNADILEFDVSEKAEQCLQEYIRRKNDLDSDFRIVVICGSDNENQSRMVASLNKYQRHNLWVKKVHMVELRKYIAEKLRVLPDETVEMLPAAAVDKDSSSVRLIKSWRAGVGKTLYKKRLEEALRKLNLERRSIECITIPLQEKNIDVDCVISTLLKQVDRHSLFSPRILHFDLAREVQNGVDYLLFNLLILGCLIDKKGYVWRKSPMDLYVVETMPLIIESGKDEDQTYAHQMLNILPEVTCRSPTESFKKYRSGQISATDQLFDDDIFKSDTFQRPFQYLHRLDQKRNLNTVNVTNIEGTKQTCLETLLRHCGIQDPSWSELHHFVSFLNTQLYDFERNAFVCTAANTDLPGFSTFVIQFLLQMSRDFSTRSLHLSEDSPFLPVETSTESNDSDLQQYQLRRTWETSPHPYLFFNADRTGFTFFGFYIDRTSGDVIDQQTRGILQRGIMTQDLYDALVRNRISLQENFDKLSRDKKIEKLCNVMGNDMPYDPDETYELTTDNAKKIMAIYMRFRCDIPVIIMGETGCGKTRLIKFMCALQNPPGVEVQNMILMKVHGGTSNADIIRMVRKAEAIAERNSNEYCINGKTMYTVLFFDEANTTESIGLIKEIMCDKSVSGKKLNLCANLKIVAACNPYRKHSEELIRKLEQAGLGYHVDAENTTDKLGRVPMRKLVYRVQPLPQSLLPLVWDFGQLNTQVEELYIRQIVRRYLNSGKLPQIPGIVGVISQTLTTSQEYMRAQKDECSFVSLRDVERALDVMSWFYSRSRKESRILFQEMDTYIRKGQQFQAVKQKFRNVDDITRSLVLALGVCYHASLGTKDQYRKEIVKCFEDPCNLPGGDQQFLDEITACQETFLNNVELTGNIAKNAALKENIFMMVVCIELRIPLFLVGKPGSSKSLAKVIVSEAMQGNAAASRLFKDLKQVQMLSFQCSPLSTPDGIVGTFRQCAQFQQDKDLDKFVSVVVLDEVGLAEDSPRMPLKTLHPLLEDGWSGEENNEGMSRQVNKEFKQVAFIGISNWALDPAKMNRGIYVQRGIPDLEELQESVRGICAGKMQKRMEPLITPLASSYLDILKKAAENKREFFGLRDFYSLVKMVNSFMELSNQNPTWHEMEHAIKRNFDGLDNLYPLECFKENVSEIIVFEDEPQDGDPDCSTAGLIQACLFERRNLHGESRYLLLLTENYGALSILQQQILSHHASIRPITIFGSSFRCDQEYTQVCRNINKIKVCMETGNTVVLLNLENLYESLYDALNQYYVYFGGERFVDLGLGTHRVKCLVHKDFRLIVVAEKQTVYKKFPIPLINRLEKHFLSINSLLRYEQIRLADKLEGWARDFVTSKRVTWKRKNHPTVEGAFIGYNNDTCPSIILHVWNKISPEAKRECARTRDEEILFEAKKVMLWCATPSSIVWMEESCLRDKEKQDLQYIYHVEQKHKSICDYLQCKFMAENCEMVFAQVTTHSNMLTANQMCEIATVTGIQRANIKFFETLTSFDTEQQFSNRVNYHLKNVKTEASLLIIQCDSGEKNANLIDCARYCVMDELEKARDELMAPVHVVFIIQLPSVDAGCFKGFQCGMWQSVHIDELYNMNDGLPDIQNIRKKTPAVLVNDAVRSAVDTQHKERCSLVHSNIPCAQSVSPLQDKETINLEKLIRSCIQSALAMVKDEEENIARSTDRVTLLLNLLTTSSEKNSFLKGISILIAKLLKEKEKDTGSIYAESMCWVDTEAAKNENLHKAGTFRRSCLKILEAKVAPVFAAVIAFLDTNQNLDILKDKVFKWKKSIWFKIFNTEEALPMKNLKSVTQNRELGEVTVKSTGINGHFFQAVMPFSWLIHDTVNEILEVPNQDEMDISTQIDLQVRVLRDSKIGRILDDFVEEHETITVLTEYIEDFVRFKYKAHSQEENKIVCQTILSMAIHTGEHFGKTHFLELLICVHNSHERLSTQLSNFQDINDVWPECSRTFLTVKDKNPNHFLFTNTDCIFSGLFLLVEELEPGPNSFISSATLAAWLQKVYKYRTVVENILNHHAENEIRYGPRSISAVKRTRGLWSRVLVVKMFIEHVCMNNKEDITIIRYCTPLWKLLGEEADLKEIKSLAVIEKFLKSCNQGFIKNKGLGAKCSTCGNILEGPPAQLPCNDMVCETCNCEILLGKKKCKMCDKDTSPDKKTECREQDRENEKKLKNYQKSCNTFFMDVVTQLCFAGTTPPSDDVIDKLITYITLKSDTIKGTKQMSVFDTGIDPSPVFRSFLLQLIMPVSETKVTEMIDAYIKEAVNIPRSMQCQELHTNVQLALLVIQCFEDNLWRESMETEEIQTALNSLRHARNVIDSTEFSVEIMLCLAETRMGLAVAAKYITKITKQSLVSSSSRNLLEEARRICVDSKCDWPRAYLVKYICRRFGVEAYRAICSSKILHLDWLIMYDVDSNKMESPDRYVVVGDSYKKIREALADVILGEDTTHLTDTMQGLCEPEGQIEVMLQLAIHREITLRNLYPKEKIGFSVKVQHELEIMCNSPNSTENELMQKLLYNKLGGHLTIAEGEDLNFQSLQCLLVHYLCTITGLHGRPTILQPMLYLIAEPKTLQGGYLPTMPQDDLEDLKVAMLDASRPDENENPVFYRCPNGHVYVVGDCGRPYVVEKCKCGAEIGGRSHKLLQTNTKDYSTDQTKPGHILGSVRQMGKTEGSIRSLSPLFCASLRLLTHMAMYLGTLNHQQAIVTLINPEVKEDEVQDFLWEHIQRNLEDLSEALGRSIDDVILIVHSVIARILTHIDIAEEYPEEMICLTTKKGRKEWEERFSIEYLHPVFQVFDAHLEACNRKLVQDERLGSGQLMCMLYETGGELPLERISTLQDVSAVWTYRTPVSLVHVKQELERMTDGRHQHVNTILQLFLQEEHYLRVLRCIPGILRLQQILIDRYKRKIDKTEASSITVGQILKDKHYGCEIKDMVDDFASAWTTVRGDLKEYLCPTAQGGEVVPDEFSTKEISDDTPVTVLFPTINGTGLCSYALLDFLMRKQNDCLDKYLKESGRTLDSLSVVQPKKITSAHLISFDTERDVMPLVLANCQYSFEVGEGTKIEYDFANLERQIIDRFLFSKSKIDVGGYLNINTMVYKTEITNASVFLELAEKIPQVRLTSAVKRQICNEIRSMPDLCRSVDNLDIAISFLKSVGGDPRCLLSKFMDETLQMETSFSSEKAIQVCQFQHAKSLWLLFSLQRSKIMADNNHQSQAIFETLVDNCHEMMSGSDIEIYEDYLKTLPADQLACLTEVLHEYILLELPRMENMDNVEINSLGEWLSAYVEGMDEPLVESWVLQNFPEDIYQMHSVYAWLVAYKALKIKDSERL